MITSVCGCGRIELEIPGVTVDEGASANITSGAAKAVKSGDRIFLIRKAGIVKFNPDQVTKNDTLDDFTFKTGTYSDICLFNSRIYAVELVSEDITEIVAIDPDSGDEQVVKTYKGDDAGDVWFNNLLGDKLYVWVGGSIYTLDKNNDIKDTGYRNPLFVTEDGVYISASAADDVNKGLSFVPNGKPGITNGSVVEYTNLKENRVEIKFKYGSRIYLTVDNKPAYIEHNGNKEVTYINIKSGLPDLSNAFVVCMNYINSPDKTLVVAVGIIDPQAAEYDKSMISYTYVLDVQTGTAEQIFEKTHMVVPLCWPSVIGEDIFVGGIGDSTDWVTAENHIK